MNKAEIYNSNVMDEIFGAIKPEELEKTKKRMLLAARIDERIKAKRWKKKDLAIALGKQPSEITRWLSGTHNFNIDTLFDIERVLGISLVSIENLPKEQVIKYHVFVSKKVTNLNTSSYISNFPTYSSVDLFHEARSLYSGKSLKNKTFEFPS